MLLVFGGTTEGKQVAKVLDDKNIPYFYSTKTKVYFKGKGKATHGALTTRAIESFCKENNITHIINASHPFAEVLHDTIAKIDIDIPLIRFERDFPERTHHPLVTYVSSFDEAIQYLKTNQLQSLLVLSGVQTIQQLKPYWQVYNTWFRILDRDVSRDIAKQAEFPEAQLLFGFPQEVEEEIKLFQTLQPEAIITKESGTNGKLEAKIEAAIATQIPLCILKRPLVSKRYLCVNTIDDLLSLILA